MKSFLVTIKGKTPYMQHRMDDTKLEEWEKKHSLVITPNNASEEHAKRAQFHSHCDNDGNFYIPSDQIRGALIGAGTLVKGKVGAQTKSMKSSVSAFFTIAEDRIPIEPFQEIDVRSAVNKNVKARVIVVRPKWNTWQVDFTLNVDNDSMPDEMILQLLEFAGNNIGIGSYRPTNNGMFGRFSVTKMSPL